jgi:hypothetical protein
MQSKRWSLVVMLLLVAVVVCALPEAAYAAPGGLVKAAAQSWVGRILFGLLVIVLFPVIIYFSVRSAIHVKRTRRDLAQLAARHQQYRWLDVNDRVTEVFNWVWSAWSQQKMSLADGYTTHWYMQNQQLQLDDWARRGVENVCHVVKVKEIVPIFVQHNGANHGEGSRLIVRINAVVVDYLQEIGTGKVVQGDKSEGDLESVWTLLWRDGQWQLNLIEDGAREWTYLFAPNEVAETTNPTPQHI